jgi:hypothetical protein
MPIMFRKSTMFKKPTMFSKIQLSVFSLLILFLMGCGGSDSKSDSNTNGSSGEPASVAPTLSETKALPGQSIGVSHESIKAGDVVEVHFQTPDASAEKQVIKATALTDGEVIVSVPPYVEAQSGEITSGTMNLFLGDPALFTSILIDPLPDLLFESRGTILLALLEFSRSQYLLSRDLLTAIGLNDQTDTAVAVAEIVQALITLGVWIDEISSQGTLTMEEDDSTIVLSGDDLNVLDRWLLLSLLAMNNFADSQLSTSSQLLTTSALQVSRLSKGKATVQNQPPVNELLRESWDDFQRALGSSPADEDVKQAITDLVEQTLAKGKDAAARGSTLLAGYISLLATGTGQLGGTAISGVSKALSQANAHFSTLAGAFTAWLTNKNTDSFRSRDREGFNSSSEFISQLARWGTNTLGNFLPGNQGGNLFSNINTGLTINDLLSAAEIEICRFEISFFCGTSATTGFTIANYTNFDGSSGSDGKDADIQLSGSQSFPVISWPGQGIALIVSKVSVSGTEPNIYGITGPHSNAIVSIGSSARYGDYSGDIEIVGDSPSPALKSGSSYVIQVQNTDFQSASLFFLVN